MQKNKEMERGKWGGSKYKEQEVKVLYMKNDLQFDVLKPCNGWEFMEYQINSPWFVTVLMVVKLLQNIELIMYLKIF
jgi:hypothetical protein